MWDPGQGRGARARSRGIPEWGIRETRASGGEKGLGGGAGWISTASCEAVRSAIEVGVGIQVEVQKLKSR